MITLNNRTSASTGFSPFFLTHGYHGVLVEREETLVVEERLNRQGSELHDSPAQKGRNLVTRWKEAATQAQLAMAYAQEDQERHANAARQVSEAYYVGDRVWLRTKNLRSNRPCKKLD